MVREPREKRKRKCLSCGFELPPMADKCPFCGATVKRTSGVVVVPGRLVRIDRVNGAIKGYRGDADDLWNNISYMAIRCARHFDRKGIETKEGYERAAKWARVQYKEIIGNWPARDRRLTPSKRLNPKVEEAVESRYNKWREGQRRQQPAEQAAPN